MYMAELHESISRQDAQDDLSMLLNGSGPKSREAEMSRWRLISWRTSIEIMEVVSAIDAAACFRWQMRTAQIVDSTYHRTNR